MQTRNRQLPLRAGGTTSVRSWGRPGALPVRVSSTRPEAQRNQPYAQSADGAHPGHGPGERFHRGPGGHVRTFDPYSTHGLQRFKGQDMQGKDWKKDRSAIVTVQARQTRAESAPRRRTDPKRPSSNGNGSHTAHGAEAESGWPLTDWGARPASPS